ncbi:MAG TPA: hypothetical protein VGV18_12950, partial [Verrucomicrobiae bacterium]|nr:hypothetical protein [Verrucomicrobiae bacterium]
MALLIILLILTAAQAYIGVEMVNTPPTENRHRWFWRVVFFAIVLSTAIVALFQYHENDAQQRDLNNRLTAVQSQLTNSLNENLEQFQQLSEEFSTNSSIALAIRVGILTNELETTIASGNELRKSHKLFDIPPIGIDAVRAEREQDLAIQENEAKQEKLQDEINAIKDQKEKSERAAEDAEQERNALKELLEMERMLSAPAIPIFDYTIRKLHRMLDDDSKGSGWTVTSDFLGQSPTIYASRLMSDDIILNGTNYITLGTNFAWDFKTSTVVTPPVPLTRLEWKRNRGNERAYSVLIIQATTTNGESKLTVAPRFRYKNSYRYSDRDSQHNNVEGSYTFSNVQILLDVPDGLNMDERCTYDSYTNTIDKALTRLIGAQDE